MNIVNVRSPFIISINQEDQIFAQVKVYVWKRGETAPTLPSFTMSKTIASTTQTECVFNISDNLKEYIDPISSFAPVGIDYESNDIWCFFKIERYYGADLKSLELIDTIDYVGVDGFTDYLEGAQEPTVIDFKVLANTNINNYFQKSNLYGYFNLLLDTDADDFTVTYDTTESSYSYNSTPEGIIMLKVPYSTDDIGGLLSCVITISRTEGAVLARLNCYPVEECKYTPVTCTFINQLGGWQYLTFFKNTTDSIAVKNNQYNLLPNNWNYAPQRGQIKNINANGLQTVKCNTGWVEENYKNLIHDLMLSETVLIDDKPAILKTQQATYKTVLKDKMINYEIEFQYAFNLLNNVI